VAVKVKAVKLCTGFFRSVSDSARACFERVHATSVAAFILIAVVCIEYSNVLGFLATRTDDDSLIFFIFFIVSLGVVHFVLVAGPNRFAVKVIASSISSSLSLPCLPLLHLLHRPLAIVLASNLSDPVKLNKTCEISGRETLN
jgi:hypothetical protein